MHARACPCALPPGARLPSLATLLLRPSLPLLFVLAASTSACLSDLRPLALRERTISNAQRARGLELLQGAALRQGLDAWERTAGTKLVLRDLWSSSLMASVAVPWIPGTRFTLDYRRHQPTGRLSFTAGSGPSRTHLILSSGETFAGPTSGPLDPTDDDEVADFFIPAIRYLHDFPFRILEATIVSDAGPRQFEGRDFDTVFATWKSVEPNPEYDQYVVWIARDNGRIEMIQYTSREEFRFSGYCTVFDRFREVDGVTTPARITILSALDTDYGDDNLHQFVIDSVAYAEVSVERPERVLNKG